MKEYVVEFTHWAEDAETILEHIVYPQTFADKESADAYAKKLCEGICDEMSCAVQDGEYPRSNGRHHDHGRMCMFEHMPTENTVVGGWEAAIHYIFKGGDDLYSDMRWEYRVLEREA